MRALLAAVLAALAGAAAQAQTAAEAARAAGSECASPVIVKCAPGSAPAAPGAVEPARKAERARRVEERRRDAVQENERVIIEDERLRLPSVEDSFKSLNPPQVKPGTHTYSTGEGAQCTCMNVCPPWWTLMPCCSCSSQPGSRQSTAPGTSPLR